MEPEPYQLFFDQSFNIGGYYTGAEIRETIDQGRTQNIAFPYENPMAYTYNRWNKGMNDIAPHFVFLWNGKYEYIGRDQPYSGSIYHVPGKEEDRYVIGHFVEGAFALFDGFNSFKDWVSSDFNGHLAADTGKKIEVMFDGAKIFKMLLIEESKSSKINSTDGYNHVKIESALGQLLKGKVQGDRFEYNGHSYEIQAVRF